MPFFERSNTGLVMFAVSGHKAGRGQEVEELWYSLMILAQILGSPPP